MMGALIGGYSIAAVFVLAPLLTSRLLERQVGEADEAALVQLRRAAESRWTAYTLGTWALISAVGAVFLVVRGRPLGWAWLGVAALYAVGTLLDRRRKQHLLERIGDRGHTDRSERYVIGATRSHRFIALAVGGYIGMNIGQYAYPHDRPPAADIALGLFALAVVVGAIGFILVRGWMYYKGDELLGD